jgi:hypothetical protein
MECEPSKHPQIELLRTTRLTAPHHAAFGKHEQLGIEHLRQEEAA